MHPPPINRMPVHVVTTIARPLCFCLLIAGCRATDRTPTITFTKVPNASAGGTLTSGFIEGQVRGARSGQKIVLYAKGRSWWVQPAADKPLTTIDSRGRWSSGTHLGGEYAALLVDPGYRPAMITDSLPVPGGSVQAVATVKGISLEKPKEPQVVHFSDYDWEISDIPNFRLGMMHDYKTANVYIDQKGFLHMKITRQGDQWTCSQISLKRSLGYGTYKFVVQDVSKLEPATVLDLYTWNASDIEQNRHELDISLTRRGDPDGKNAEFVVQPYYVPQNVSKFLIGPGLMTYSLEWRQSTASFMTTPGASGAGGARNSNIHVFTSGIPSPGNETTHMNLCAWSFGKVQMHDNAEVVIEKFQYLP